MRRIVPLVLLLVLWVPSAGAWTWPVSGPVLQGFTFDRAHPYAAGQHRGVDIGAAGGAPVFAPAAGVVTFAGTVPTSGKSVTIETPGGLSVTLTHLGSIAVARNTAVSEGAVVGTVGPTGTPEVDGPYVHLGVRTTADDQGYLDPLGFLPVLALPVPAPAPVAPPAPVEPPAAPPAPVAPPALVAPPAAGEPPAAPAASPASAESPASVEPPVTPAAPPAPAEAPAPAVSDPPAQSEAPAETPAEAASSPVAPPPAETPPPAAAEPVVPAASVAAPPVSVAPSDPAASPPAAEPVVVPAPASAAAAVPLSPPEPEAPQAAADPAAADPTAGAETVAADPLAEQAFVPEGGLDWAPEPEATAAAPPEATRAATPALEPLAFLGRVLLRVMSHASPASLARRAETPRPVAPASAQGPAALAAPAAGRHAQPIRVAIQPLADAPAASHPDRSLAPLVSSVIASLVSSVIASLGLALIGFAGLAAGCVAAARIIRGPSPTTEGARPVAAVPEDPRRARMALREWAAPHRPRRRIRRSGGRVRALPPAEGQRRPDGQRDGRARHAGDGVRRPERRIAA